MLNLIYKIISKLLTLQIQPFVPRLVDKEQTGFIKGQKILDNILTLKIEKEHMKIKKILALLLKLNFMKAYDRLDQWFLREVLQILGFSKYFIMLIMALVDDGSEKFHTNGIFMDEILLDRGVCQGCPLTPLPFSLASQPLMSLLKHKEEEGRLEGIPIGDLGE